MHEVRDEGFPDPQEEQRGQSAFGVEALPAAEGLSRRVAQGHSASQLELSNSETNSLNKEFIWELEESVTCTWRWSSGPQKRMRKGETLPWVLGTETRAFYLLRKH